MKTYHINVTYAVPQNLYHITTMVESVRGAKIQYLNFTSNGKKFTGFLVVETFSISEFKSVLKLIRSSPDCCLL